MTVCPKCSYSLVLLEKRRRYKCAKCGRLYMQKPIEDIGFRRWNEKQREFTREEAEKELEQLWSEYRNLNNHTWQMLTEEEKLQKKKDYYQKNRAKLLEMSKSWAKNNKDKASLHKKNYRQNNREKCAVPEGCGIRRT